MNKPLMTAGIALALGVVWTAGPALAQQPTGEKAESKTERAKDKAVEMKDTVKEKARDVKDKVKAKTTDKMERATDRMNAKAEKTDVMAMQQALKEKGHDPGPIDGVMGPRTTAALRDYQSKEGLKATGRWDDETAMKLGVRTSLKDKETITPSASPATPEDKTAPPAKRSSP